MRARVLLPAFAVVLSTAAPSVDAGQPRSGVIVVKVTTTTGCGPETYGEPGPPPRPFDANIHFRNRDTGERWVIRSGDDGRIRRRFPVGRYRILPGQPREQGIDSSKDRAYLRLSRDEVERTTIAYSNGCLAPG